MSKEHAAFLKMITSPTSRGPAGENLKKTHCNRGHEFTEENTQWVGGQGNPQRQCKACARARQHNRTVTYADGTTARLWYVKALREGRISPPPFGCI